MTTLAELLPALAGMPWPDAQAQAVVVPSEHVPSLITVQDGAGVRAVFPLSVDPASFAISLDMVKFAQEGGSGMAPGFYDAIVAVAAECEVIAQDARPPTSQRSFPPGLDANNPPEWAQPLGAHDAYPLNFPVSHKGFTYSSLMDANVWEPSPQSALWAIYPDPGPLPWVRPTGSSDAYDVGDVVTHEVAGRDVIIWQSNISANTTEPGTDGTFDRWWAPLDEAPVPGPQPWQQPLPGVWPAYSIGAQVTHKGTVWMCTFEQNVWEPGVFGWDAEGGGFAAAQEDDSLGKSRQQELAALRRRESGKFVADVPGTAENEAWISGEAPE
jgi:hypothetical protein